MAFSLLAVLYALAQLWSGPGPVYADSYDYGRVAYSILGEPPAEARSQAVDMLCRSSLRSAERLQELEAVKPVRPIVPETMLASCITQTNLGMASRAPRYTAIFDSRPGYPYLVSVVARFVGVPAGLWVVAIVSTLVGAGLVMLIMHRLGLSWVGQLLAGALYLSLPVGTWSVQLLSDGPALDSILLVVLGNVLLLQKRLAPGILLSCVGYLAAFAVKSSEGLLYAALATVAAAAGVILVPRLRRLESLALAAVNLAGLVGLWLGASALGWPGFSESLQDTFTNHFKLPDVSDPWHRLLELNKVYWHYWLAGQAGQPLLIVVGVVAAAALCYLRREYAGVLLAACMLGPVTVIAHPLYRQSDRLFSPTWLVVAFGGPLIVDALARGRLPIRTSPTAPAEGCVTTASALQPGGVDRAVPTGADAP